MVAKINLLGMKILTGIFTAIKLIIGILMGALGFVFNRYVVGGTTLVIILCLAMSIVGTPLTLPLLIFFMLIGTFVGITRCLLDIAKQFLPPNPKNEP